MCQTLAQLIEQMESCYQFQVINMLQHGQMVHEWYKDLVGTQSKEWDFGKVGDIIEQLISRASKAEELELYHTYHDIGKPLCRTVDEQGRQHFPNHAQVSYDAWMQATGDENIGWYILHDMDFHTLKGDELDATMNDPRAINLLLTAWSEVHANAQMFGGIESTSFKIKRKQLEKNTKLLFAKLSIDS